MNHGLCPHDPLNRGLKLKVCGRDIVYAMRCNENSGLRCEPSCPIKMTKMYSNTVKLMQLIHPKVTINSVFHFYRATACNATHGIAIAILSVRPSDACIVTKLNNAV